jgi:hypothetical protein
MASESLCGEQLSAREFGVSRSRGHFAFGGTDGSGRKDSLLAELRGEYRIYFAILLSFGFLLGSFCKSSL